MMAQSRAESTRDTCNYGQYINQFPQNTIKVIREFERIQKKICRHKMSIMFNEICIYIYIHIYIYIYIYIYVCVLIPAHCLMGIVFANGPGDLGSIPGRVISKTREMLLDTSLLNSTLTGKLTARCNLASYPRYLFFIGGVLPFSRKHSQRIVNSTDRIDILFWDEVQTIDRKHCWRIRKLKKSVNIVLSKTDFDAP